MRIKRKTGQPQLIIGVLNLIMSLTYLVCGIILWLNPRAAKFIPFEYVKTVAVLISVYGFFRLYRSYLHFTQRSLN